MQIRDQLKVPDRYQKSRLKGGRAQRVRAGVVDVFETEEIS
jgi:DNA-directed RNA polymerase subunit K/omega